VELTIASYAERAGITLVLRASRDEETSTNNPQDVVKEVSQMVIYSAAGMDITQTILNALNAQDKSASVPKGNVNQGKTTSAQPPRVGEKKGATIPVKK
jgi:hypothetical protein